MLNKKLKIIFAGTPQFAVPALQLIYAAGFDICLVLTQPDRRSGRGMLLNSSFVKNKAVELGIPVYQPEKLSLNSNALNKISSFNADILIVAAYGLILPEEILKLFPKKSYNVHASLLPRWRGAAPIHRAIESGDKQLGVTIMEVVSDLDAGPMIRKKSIDIEKLDTTGSMTIKLSKIGARLMVEVLEDIQNNKKINFTVQNESLVTYAKKITKVEAKLNIREPMAQILRKINAFNPYPIIFSFFRGKIIRIWEAEESKGSEATIQSLPGELIVEKDNLFLKVSDGVLKINKIQPESSSVMSAKDFISGYQVKTNNFLQ
mgnify:CR=1 FL=1